MTACGVDIQIDDGDYTRIHHAILEALAEARLSGAEFRVLMFLLRKTYGWNKKEDRISLSQWAEATRAARPHVLKTLNLLVAKRIIIRREDDGQVPWYSFNKYREEWQGVFDKDSARGDRFKVLPEQIPLPKQVTVTQIGNSSVTRTGNKSVTRTGTHNKQDRQSIDSVPVSAKPKEPTEQQAVFSAVAEVCKLDPALKAKSIGSAASKLVNGRYSAADVRVFGEWWVSDRWRKEHTPVPKTADLIDKILQAKEWADRRNGQSVDRNDWMDDPQVVAARRARGEI